MCILSDINFNEFFLYLSPFPKFCSLSRVVKSEHVCLSKQNIVTWNNLNILITVQISTNSKIVFLYVTVPSHLFNFHYINITCPKYIQNVINSKLYKTVIADRSIILGHHAVRTLFEDHWLLTLHPVHRTLCPAVRMHGHCAVWRLKETMLLLHCRAP